MQKLNLVLILASITFLSSCNDFPKITPRERCVIVLFPEENPTMEESYCRCHKYGWSRDKIGRVSESTNYDIMKCNKFAGYSPDDTLEIYMWQEKIRLWLIRHEK